MLAVFIRIICKLHFQLLFCVNLILLINGWFLFSIAPDDGGCDIWGGGVRRGVGGIWLYSSILTIFCFSTFKYKVTVIFICIILIHIIQMIFSVLPFTTTTFSVCWFCFRTLLVLSLFVIFVFLRPRLLWSWIRLTMNQLNNEPG